MTVTDSELLPFLVSLITRGWVHQLRNIFNEGKCSEVYEVGTTETKSYLRENINFKNSIQQFHCILSGSFHFFTHIFIRTNCLLFPNHTTLSAVKVTKATILNGKHSEPSYIADLIECKMHNEHLSLIVYLLNLSPAKVMCLAGALESKNATVVDAKVQLVAPVVLQQTSWLHLSN